MKNFVKKMIFLVALVVAGSFAFAEQKQRVMYVKEKNATLKEKASFFGKKVATLAYGQEVIVISTNGSWMKVETADKKKRGWIKKSSLTNKKLSGVTSISTDADTMSLAGKGSENTIQDSDKEKSNLGDEK
ncbi:MAG: SH3 domain-containing protein [Treponema sp.]|nr:SH3 domain-containing protein [Treponema sp.]